jgi:urease accessory protein
MRATIVMITTDASLLRLLTWLSPAFPTGAFTCSHGLEWVVEAGDIRDAATLQEWLTDVVRHGAGPSDCILLRHAHRAARETTMLREIAEIAAAVTPARERLVETLGQGTAFLRAACAWELPTLPNEVAYPIAVGALAGWHHIDEDGTVTAYLQAFVSNLISAAVRLVPLGQSVGVQVLASLEPVILATVEDTSTASLEDIGSCAFRSDLAAMRHETQYTRLFRS